MPCSTLNMAAVAPIPMVRMMHDRGSEPGFPLQRPQAQSDVTARLVEPLQQRDTL